jgi:adenylate cyclase
MHVLWRGDTLQKLRLVSGLVLFTFALTHFLNHSIGLFSIDLMQDVQQWRWVITRSWLGTIILAAALTTHIALAFYKLASRSTLQLPRWEAIQIGLGLLIPFLLFPHIVNTRFSHMLFGVNDIYLYELLKLWPASAITQSLLLLLVWIHGCIGIHFWLRLYAPYRRLGPLLLGLAIIIPAAALGGFMVAGRAANAIAADPRILTSIKSMTNWPSDAHADQLAGMRTLIRFEYAALLAIIATYVVWTRLERRFGPKVTITYVGGPTVKMTRGPTLLEISRMAKVPHAAICGGRARCSTCRVRVERGSGSLPAPVFPEIVTLGSIKAPPNVRLACQIRPESNLVVTRLLRAGTAGPEDADPPEEGSEGIERPLCVMFVDLRGFTRLSEKRLPFDVVFILNEFFGVVGAAIADQGGRIDKYLGDGLLAVFGESGGLEAGCRQALRTVRAIDIALDHVNASLEVELGQKLEVGIGIDAGSLVVGRIGFGDAADFTVIGTPVNVASRLEALAKEKGYQMMLSREVAARAGWEPANEFTTTITVRGVAEPIEVIGFPRGRDLPASILTAVDDAEQLAMTAGRKAGRLGA